ncbi:MAG: S1 RNA-binding domain-containing protein, partial [Bryobacterales bacterium]|nr:S1 RNA-binding domain-containing protein [Bryobacterales bacterium]
MNTEDRDLIPGNPQPAEESHPELPEEFVPDTPDDMEQDSMEQLLDDYSNPDGFREGEVIHGRVLEIRDAELIVDVGQKAEGAVPIEQVRDAGGNVRFAVGDAIDVVATGRADFSREGYIPLSFERVGRMMAWDNLEKAHKDDLPVLGRVLARTKGGLTVDVGMKAFMPASHVDIRPVQNLDQLVGQDLPVKILKMNRRRSNVVVSRRSILEKEMGSRKEQTLEALAEGAVLTGLIKSLTEYGAFVDLGGIDGLLHVSD